MKRIFFITLFFAILHAELFAQPKVVVLIVLDQYPEEYLTRFQPYFSEQGGLHYLLSHGAQFLNANYEHAYTKTAPGHTALSTGAYGHLTGIIANHWYDRSKKKVVGCVDDEAVKELGNNHIGKSPRTLQTYTFGDMLRLHTNFQSKVITLSNKDRSAILMAGKYGKAYWIEDSLVVSSTYYMNELPSYIREFNHSGMFQQYFGKEWKELQPDIAARICDVVDAPYEASVLNLGRTFPHRVTGDNETRRTSSYYDAVELTPFAEEILLEAAKKAVVAESLGQRGTTDMLCIGVSSTDELGHPFGPQSHEVFDMSLRTDTMLGDFFRFLDQYIGLENCLIVLSSDHGIPPIPEYLKKVNPKAEAGRVSYSDLVHRASEIFERAFPKVPRGSKWIEQAVESDIYLNRELLEKYSIPIDLAASVLRDSLPAHGTPFLAAFTQRDLQEAGIRGRYAEMVARSCYPARSGDVMFILKPYYINSGDSVGTTHGQPHSYDTHVPIIFAGKGIPQGIFPEEVHPTDIAPTLASLLGVEIPPSAEGHVLTELFSRSSHLPLKLEIGKSKKK